MRSTILIVAVAALLLVASFGSAGPGQEPWNVSFVTFEPNGEAEYHRFYHYGKIEAGDVKRLLVTEGPHPGAINRRVRFDHKETMVYKTERTPGHGLCSAKEAATDGDPWIKSLLPRSKCFGDIVSEYWVVERLD